MAGDSTVAGTGTNMAADPWPVQLRTALATLGYPVAGTGPVPANQHGTPVDARWVFDVAWTEWAITAHSRSAASSGKAATFTSDLPGTIVDLYHVNNSSGPLSVVIDGGAPSTVTPAAGASLAKTTFSGLADTTHTVAITTTTASTSFIGAVDVHRATGLEIGNFGVGTTIADHWDAPDWFALKQTVIQWAPHAVFVLLEVNDAVALTASATYAASMLTIVSTLKAAGIDVILVTGFPGNGVNYTAYTQALYDLADTQDVPLIDLQHYFGSYADMDTAGSDLMADGLHPNRAGYAATASLFARVFG